MIATKEEKESLDDLLRRFQALINDYQDLAETNLELLSFMRSICEELGYSNPTISKRIINKVTDIMNR